ncbi:MAG: SDR family oxidoreductase, partial [Chloroflexi bacterium]|nr:SDR family oxidoreductase [Chloroflexota bacterium]
LAHIHFPASAVAGERIIRMGEDPATVHVVGCPRMDLAKEVLEQDARHPGEWMDWQDGVGVPLDLSGPYLVVAQYPVTSEFGDGERQISETLKALQALKLPTVMLWPNADAGGEDIAQGMRRFREGLPELEYIHFYKNLPVEVYLRLVAHASCIAGNTSSAIREAAFLGTPAVNIGNRQQGRDRGQNVIDAPHDKTLIKEAVERYGRLDVLYSAAGGGFDPARSFTDVDEAFWIQTMTNTVTGLYNLAQAVHPFMKERGRGAVVTVAASFSVRQEGNPAYGAAKGGVIGLSQNLSREFYEDNIRVNAISTGPRDTLSSRVISRYRDTKRTAA